MLAGGAAARPALPVSTSFPFGNFEVTPFRDHEASMKTDEAKFLAAVLSMPILRAAFNRPGSRRGDRRPNTVKSFLRRWFAGRNSKSKAAKLKADLEPYLSHVGDCDALVGTASILQVGDQPRAMVQVNARRNPIVLPSPPPAPAPSCKPFSTSAEMLP